MKYGPRGPGRKARTAIWKAREGLWLAGSKVHRRRKRPCRSDCCVTPSRVDRKRLKVRLREEGW